MRNVNICRKTAELPKSDKPTADHLTSFVEEVAQGAQSDLTKPDQVNQVAS